MLFSRQTTTITLFTLIASKVTALKTPSNNNNDGGDTVISNCMIPEKVEKMFSYSHKVYVGNQNKMIQLDLANDESSGGGGGKISKSDPGIEAIQMATHFDTVNECEPEKSNADFCSRSNVFKQLIILIGHGHAITTTTGEDNNTGTNRSSGNGNTNHRQTVQFYRYHNDTHKSVLKPADIVQEYKSNSILPSINARLFTLIQIFFEQIANNDVIRFTGVTYDHHSDTLYTTATVRSPAIYKDVDAWNAGQHILFGAKFTPTGLLQDSFAVLRFDRPASGLIDHNGALYALVNDGKMMVVVEIKEDNFTGKHYTLQQFFCSPTQSPLYKPDQPPTQREDRTMQLFNFPRLAQHMFPHLPNELKYIDSSLLTGGTFVTIVTVLSVLLVLIVAVDVYIIYSMNRKNENHKMIAAIGSGVVPGSRSYPSNRRSSIGNRRNSIGGNKSRFSIGSNRSNRRSSKRRSIRI